MATERKWLAVPTQALTANGSIDGSITIASAHGFHTKQIINIQSNTIPQTTFQVKRVYSTKLMLGLVSEPVTKYSDMSAYLVADNAQISANEQQIPVVKDTDIFQAVYEREAAVAIRTLGVDEFGNPYTADNPLPTSATFSGQLNVHLNGVDPDGDSVHITDATTGNNLEVNPDGSINVNITGESSGTVKNIYGEVLALTSNVLTTLATYTVPIDKKAVLIRADGSSDNFATYSITKNAAVIAKKRTWFGMFNAEFGFFSAIDNGIPLVAGDIVQVQVIHSRPFVSDFNANLVISET